MANEKGEVSIAFRDARKITLSTGEIIQKEFLRHKTKEAFDVLQINLRNITGRWTDCVYILARNLPSFTSNRNKYKRLSKAARLELECNYFKSIVNYNKCVLTTLEELFILAKNNEIGRNDETNGKIPESIF